MGIGNTQGGVAQADTWAESRVLESGVAKVPEVGFRQWVSLSSMLKRINEWEVTGGITHEVGTF